MHIICNSTLYYSRPCHQDLREAFSPAAKTLFSNSYTCAWQQAFEFKFIVISMLLCLCLEKSVVEPLTPGIQTIPAAKTASIYILESTRYLLLIRNACADHGSSQQSADLTVWRHTQLSNAEEEDICCCYICFFVNAVSTESGINCQSNGVGCWPHTWWGLLGTDGAKGPVTVFKGG